ncbi:MAG: alpha-L-fucosidase, partial [Kiritimatiellae bacterium]|nr:alpha-L-fucosidase [Kiritimatiellia bacterium]
SYCVTSPNYLRLLAFYLEEARYDVIHFNNGLHSLGTPTADWTSALERALRLIREMQPSARIVWATSTPLADPVKTKKCRELNEAGRGVVERLGGIAIDNLFALLDPLDRAANWSDTYHHKPETVRLEAGQVARAALAAANLRPVPRPAMAARIAAGDCEIYGIVHWGLNTFTDREWGMGDEDPELLAPASFDADQIVGACKAGGLAGLVVVAKHHDGFCLWPTKTTGHNISKSTGFRGGMGDYVREMSEACRRQGLRFGVYVSPWDRNNADYASPRYVETFHAQIRELLGGAYGEVFEMWFDGANGGDGYYGGARERRKISAGYYRFPEVFRFVREMQPNLCIFAGENDGSDLRWPGNEMGWLDPDSSATVCSVGESADHREGGCSPAYMKVINTGTKDGDGASFFRVCECDFPLRPGWFYHAKEDGRTKSGLDLLRRYLNTVGNGGTMNIGIAPNRDGLLADEDVKALSDFGRLRSAFFAHEVREGLCNVIVMREDVGKFGEACDSWRLLDGDKELLSGKTIGVKRIRALDTPRPVAGLRLECVGGDGKSVLPIRFYSVAPEFLRAAMSDTSDSEETETAKWMAAASAQ